MKKPFEKCPVCGGELAQKEVEKLLKGGNDTAIIKVRADICLKCGERFYDQKVVREFETIRSKLQRRQTKEFQPVGKLYRISKSFKRRRKLPLA